MTRTTGTPAAPAGERREETLLRAANLLREASAEYELVGGGATPFGTRLLEGAESLDALRSAREEPKGGGAWDWHTPKVRQRIEWFDQKLSEFRDAVLDPKASIIAARAEVNGALMDVLDAVVSSHPLPLRKDGAAIEDAMTAYRLACIARGAIGGTADILAEMERTHAALLSLLGQTADGEAK